MKVLLLSFLLLSASFSVFAQNPGDTMPAVAFYNRDASPFLTNNIPKGKESLVIFFDATCEHCQRVVAALDKRAKDLEKINIYLVSQDEYRSIDYFTGNFAKQLTTQKNVKVLQDRDHVFIMAFHPKEYPGIYLYSPEKILRFYSSNEKQVAKLLKMINP
ncbi:redoxin domain-containing protein [Pedobacter sp. MC2016-14]|uniref:TlpA family protein disulfide reductase n=1 Tax=Pedobacter sp. MC2016-14 TaxID=2897327 RepID=UPI001E4CE253|nr:redoxin domain-containing protein [Pedobacter sp. MC2016-14]MCD0489215.1 redoxin domain-containing protein [Pedobacter sp. MC2016-14]